MKNKPLCGGSSRSTGKEKTDKMLEPAAIFFKKNADMSHLG